MHFNAYFNLLCDRFCGTVIPPYTINQPLISSISEVTILFNMAAMRGLMSYDDGDYLGFQLCFKAGIVNLMLQKQILALFKEYKFKGLHALDR